MAYSEDMSISVLAVPVMALGLLVPSTAAPAAACTSPAVVRDGLIDLTCFPKIPVKQFPKGSQKCNHIDSWATEVSTVTVGGQRYKITQKFRDDVWICRA